MDPKFNVEWHANEIEMARSLITSHDANKRCTKNTNDKRQGIVDELHARFPRKDRRQVTNLYVDLVVEMINNAAQKSSKQQLPMMIVSNNDLDLVVNNSGVTLETPSLQSMDALHGYLPHEMKATKRKMVEEQHHRKVVIPQQDRPRAGRFWTLEEHRNFLSGLRVYGRGNWKSIARDFVPSKTAVQVSSHAQKFFHRQESTTKKLRYSINDVGLYNAEPWAQNNSSNWEAFTFTNNAYNPYCYGFGGQHASMDILAQVYSSFASQASSSQTATSTEGQQQAPIFSPAAPMMEGDGTQMAWTSYY